MNILLKNVVIVDPGSKLNGKKTDLGIVNGLITTKVKEAKFGKEVDLKGAAVCPGFFDMRAFMGEPGLEHKEDFNTFQKAAAKGGFTHVAILPNTIPVMDNKDMVHNLRSRTTAEMVTLHPYAALSKGAKGEELSEMIDLNKAGAVAFTDGHELLKQPDLLLKGLQYARSISTTIITVPSEYHLSKKGIVNEGITSTQLGLPGIPHLAEIVAIERDLRILEYAGGRLHFSLITTAEGVELIRKAKKNGLAVTCDVGAHYLAYDDSVLNEFDSNYKVFPPFRLKKDTKALQKGLKDGTIDVIVSDHRPQNIEGKKLEFDQAADGISSIETTISHAIEHSGLSFEQLVEHMSINPRKVLGLAEVHIEEGAVACLSIIDFAGESKVQLVSKSKNNPLNGEMVKGKVLGVVNGKKAHFNEI